MSVIEVIRTPTPIVEVVQGGAQGPQGPQGPPGPAGPAGAYTQTWAWTTKTGDASSNGQLGINSVGWATATQVNVAERSSDNSDVSAFFARVKVGDDIYLQAKNNAANWARYTITGAPVDQGSWWSFPVAYDSSGGVLPGGNNATTLSFLTQGASGYTTLFSQTLASAAASIDTGATIPGGYSALEITFLGRSTAAVAVTTTQLGFQFNGDGAANYRYADVYGVNATPSAGNNQAAPEAIARINTPGASIAANIPGYARMFIPAYDGTVFEKIALVEHGMYDSAAAANSRIRLAAVHWPNTAPITRIAIVAQSGQVAAGSRLIVRGIP
jgi:hypothetical protein